MVKLLGAIFIIGGCSGIGFSMCQSHKRAERELAELMKALQWMCWELDYRLPPLEELCRGAGEICSGNVSAVLKNLATELQRQIKPDAAACLHAALLRVPRLSPPAAENINALGATLGRFDLQGQLAGLEATTALCRRDLDELRRDRHLRLRNYRTLGLCTGVALVILFI